MSGGHHVLTGAAGEDYVLYELHRRGILAAQTPTNAYLADILVFDPEMSVGAMVQVKARKQGRLGWPMTVKHELVTHPRLLYVFVDLETTRRPPTCSRPRLSQMSCLARIKHGWHYPARVGERTTTTPCAESRAITGFP